MSDEGKPQHDGDMAAQLALSMDNLEAVLGEAGMSLANVVRLNVYTTDVDLLFQHYGVLAGRLGAAGVAPATTMLGVTRLAIPGQLVELEGTAVA
jgi:enamine deaminase RidA (YjgF/YER057c/UK114 family)